MATTKTQHQWSKICHCSGLTRIDGWFRYAPNRSLKLPLVDLQGNLPGRFNDTSARALFAGHTSHIPVNRWYRDWNAVPFTVSGLHKGCQTL